MKNSCLLADENRRFVKEKHRLAEENRAMRNSLTLMNQRIKKNADPLFFHIIAKAAERKKEDIRDLRRILMEVVEQKKNLKDTVHISEHARQEIKAEFEILRKLQSLCIHGRYQLNATTLRGYIY